MMGSPVVSLLIPYLILVVYFVVTTRTELTARCEGSHLGIAGGFLINALHSPYGFPGGRHTGRIDNKV